MQVERVQKWVMSSLLLTTAVIFAGGLCFLAAVATGEGAKPGLLVMAAIVGVLAMAGVRVLNALSVVTPWLLLGLLPAVVGWYFIYG